MAGHVGASGRLVEHAARVFCVFRRHCQVCVRKILKSPGRAPKCRSLRRPCRIGWALPAKAIGIRGIVVWLIVYYVVFMITGDLAAYIIGLVTEREFGGQVSLIVFLVLYFLFLWVAWVLAVWITKPSHVEPAST